MPRLRPAVLLLALGLAASVAHATAFTPHMPLALEEDESVATTDDARALVVNPAAIGLRYPSEAFEGFARYDRQYEWNSTLFTRGRFGLLALRQRDTSQTYGFGLAAGGERLRFGFTPYQLVSGQPKEHTLDYRFGLLSRPTPWLSSGFTVDRAFQPRFRGERRARHYTLGLGWRPLAMSRDHAFGWGTRLTFSGDVTIVDDGEWRQSRVRIAGQFEPAPGVILRATVGDHRNLRAGLTLAGVRWHAHGGESREAGRIQYQSYAVSVHAGEEPSALGLFAAPRVAVVRAGGVLADESMAGGALSGGEGTVSARPIHRQLAHALEDPLTRGVLLEVNGVGNMAQLEELRPRLASLRAAGKPVVAYLENGGGRGDLYLASACDRIVATEEGDFLGLGLRTERRYWRSALARIGVRIDRSSTGAFKSAYRNFSVDSMPPADSVVVQRDLDQRQKLFVDAVCADRHLSPERLATFLDGREWSPEDLARGGVIDSVGYREDAMRILGGMTRLGAKPRTADLERTPRARRAWTLPRRIAIVYAGGGIETGRSGTDLLTGPTLGSTTLVEELERAFRTPDVRAVVLRIESPGGSALASNLIDHAVQRLRRETGKPLVVSMGSLAGSGGYYIACHADWIVADRHTRTGSIGVLTVKPSFEGLYEKLGARSTEFDRGDYMRGTSYARDWGPREQAAADSTIQRLYRGFVAKVADGRHLDPAVVHESAQGRVWMGDDALARRLIDQIGGLEDAVREARRRAGVPEGERIRPLELGRPRGTWLERLLGGWVRDALARDARLPDFSGAQMIDPEVLDGLAE